VRRTVGAPLPMLEVASVSNSTELNLQCMASFHGWHALAASFCMDIHDAMVAKSAQSYFWNLPTIFPHNVQGNVSEPVQIAHLHPTALLDWTSAECHHSLSFRTQMRGTACTCRRSHSAMARSKRLVFCPAHHHGSTPSCSPPDVCKSPPSPQLLAPTPCPARTHHC
jgi:hypothetical protein